LGRPLENRVSKGGDAASLTDAVQLVLRRIIRLLVGTVSYPALVDLIRVIYVEEAEKKIVRSGSKATKSALALMTGLDTRVVSNVLDSSFDGALEAREICAENALLDMWSNDPFFQNPETGNPAILPVEGRGRTFQGLILKSVGRNITVKTVLDRLLSSGNVKIHSDAIERVEMLSQFYSPISDDVAKMTDIAYLESSRVLSAAIHNMNSDPELRVPQQGRWTYRLDPQNYRQFRREARALLEKQIKEGEKLLERFEELEKQPGQLTVGIGWYQWGGHETDEEGDRK
jgi:hypothetical protein